ncbi:MAG: VPS10 domain-containing protein [Gemmatimonadaceae bacterium]
MRLKSFISFVLLISPSLAAQPSGAARQPPPIPDSVRTLGTAAYLRSLRWRNVGPFRGGRAVAVAGDPRHSRVFYFGAVDGGVWKTIDGGASWRNITDGRSPIASVGAIAVAHSDPNVLYVGTGESDFREDLTYGDGIYRSTDGGESWKHLGLTDTRHIAAVRVDPQNPDVVFVAAFGHAFGPSAERGIYRSRDGGTTWKRVLFLDDSTGAIDLAMDPGNSRILYAAMWKFQRYPWGMEEGGGKTGLWKSTDGGDSWKELSDNPGMPTGPKGRIGITVSPANPQRLWASVEAADSAGGIFRSDDAGRTWHRVNAEQKFHVRPWYYSGIFADTRDANTVYVLNLGTWRSVDEGKSYTRIRVPHGDCHILWIDPDDPNRMITGNDGGAEVSFDGGASWSSVMNQPTAQFYHVTTDNQFPYRIYGAQQDNSTVSILSRSDAGAITREDWHSIGGGESGYIAPSPADPNIVFAGTYMGTITRMDVRTRQERDITAWLNNHDGIPASDVKYRFQWTFPILFSPHDPKTLYITSQYVMKTTNEGQSWQRISPDLTLHDPKTLGPVGGPVTRDMTGTEWYATIFAFAESPVTAGVLWAGSDDGLVHLSRDGGANWSDITPKGIGRFTRMSIIEPSHFDAGTAYIAANRYQQDDFRPYLFRTTDYGKTWTTITRGIPDGAYTRAIREDPSRRGLLYAGTETGIYISFDDGANWQSLQLNLPRTSVRDITIHGSDLIVATHGRAFWAIDDISPLRQMTDAIRAEAGHLFAPQPATRFGGGGGRTLGAGENPPAGAIIDYHFRDKPTGDVKLEILDHAGTVIRTFHSAGLAKDSADTTNLTPGGEPKAAVRTRRDSASARDSAQGKKARIEEGTDSVSFAPSDSIVPTRAGSNRFIWNLRYPDSRTIENIIVDEGTTSGPLAAPGQYSIRLTAGGRPLTQPLTVIEDPRITVSQADLDAQFAMTLKVRDEISRVSDAVRRIEGMQKQIDAQLQRAKGQTYAGQVSPMATKLRDSLESVRSELAEVHSHADQSTLNYPIKLYNKLLSLNQMVQSADARPTDQEGAVFEELSSQVERQLGRLRVLESRDVASFNKLMRDLNVPAVGVPEKTTAVP